MLQATHSATRDLIWHINAPPLNLAVACSTVPGGCELGKTTYILCLALIQTYPENF